MTLSSQRKYRLLVTIAATAVGAIITIVLMSVSWNVDEPNERFVKLITFSLFPLFSAIAGAWWVKKLQNIHVASLRGVIADAACRFFDDLAYYRDPGEQFDHTRFSKLGVLPERETKVEDLFVGRYRDTDFKLVEARVDHVMGTGGNITVFQGLLFEIDVPFEFSGCLLIGRDRGHPANAYKTLFMEKFEKESGVTFDHAAFEQRYAVFASDADEARRLITLEFRDFMVAHAKARENKSALSQVADLFSFGASFVDSTLRLALPVEGELFEPGSIKRSIYDCEDDIHEFLDHLMLAHRVIDYLLGDRSPVHASEHE